MGEPSHDPSVFLEPHLRPPPPAPEPYLAYARPDTPDVGQIDTSQDVRNEPIYAAAGAGPGYAGAPGAASVARPGIDNTVWDEPALAGRISPGPGDLTYQRWLAEGRARWGFWRSWGFTLLIALAAGPWAVAGAFMNGGQSAFGILVLVLFAPVTEELMKVAAPSLAVEKAPYVFRSPAQIILCALAGGLVFAVIENLLYLHVYIDDPSPRLIAWRWTICVALHTVCSLVAGVGVVRVWRDVQARQARPRLTLAYPYAIAAMVVHGVYNAAAIVIEQTGFLGA